MIRHGLRRDGYIAWVERLARRLGVADSIDWLGALDGPAIVTELHMAAAAIIPTFVESYCLAMAEAMCVGTPVVASFTGGTSHLGCDGQTCLFFQPGDVAMLAYQVIRLLESTSLARSISAAGRRVALSRHCTEQVAGAQLTTYQQMLAEQTHK
jgi:glycosyltransferase involved in cell wall biosynthesis